LYGPVLAEPGRMEMVTEVSVLVPELPSLSSLPSFLPMRWLP